MLIYNPGKPAPGDLGRYVARQLQELSRLLRGAARLDVVVTEAADGVAVTIPHSLGATPLAVCTEVAGGVATVSVDAKTEATVTLTVATTPGSGTRTVTLALLA